jgi:hypothetical protein
MSSFLYRDIKLMHELKKIAQQPVVEQNNAALQALLRGLEQQILQSHSKHGTVVSHQSQGDVGLRANDLQTPKALLDFLSNNKITVNGQRVAFTTAENPNNEQYQLIEMDNNEGQYVNLQLLSQYIISLQAGLERQHNAVLSTMLVALIRQLNQQLDLDISEQYHSPGPKKQIKPQGQTPQEETGTTGTINQEQLLHDIAGISPFSSNNIDLDDIQRFATKYAQLASGDPNVVNLAQKLEREVAFVNSIRTSPGVPINMDNLTAEQFKMQTSQPQQLATALWGIVSDAGALYQKFYNQNRTNLTDAESRTMQQQIMYPQHTNLMDLNRLLADLRMGR